MMSIRIKYLLVSVTRWQHGYRYVLQLLFSEKSQNCIELNNHQS
jgi:hypothetical protein